MKATTNRNSDERVDAVLRQMHSAQPLPGMEERLLARLQAHAVERPAADWIFGRWRLRLREFAMPRFAMPVCATLLAIAATSVVLRRHAVAPVESPVMQRPGSEAARTIASAPPAAPLPQRAIQLPAQPRRAAALPTVSEHTPAHEPLRLSTEAELAREEASAPSHPAPELPLTAEERHLQRAVRGREPVEIAELQPEQRRARQNRDDAAFQQFFEPDPPAATEAAQGDAR